MNIVDRTNPWDKYGPEIYKGLQVYYHPNTGAAEKGVVTSWNLSWIFVRFGNDPNSRACHPGSVGTLLGRRFK